MASYTPPVVIGTPGGAECERGLFFGAGRPVPNNELHNRRPVKYVPIPDPPGLSVPSDPEIALPAVVGDIPEDEIDNMSSELLENNKQSLFSWWEDRIGIATSERYVEFIRALSAEFVGTVLLVLIGCGMPMGYNTTGKTLSTLTAAISFMALLPALIIAFQRHSGAVFNPAVTLALVVTREMSIVRGISYTIVQMLGSCTGAAFLIALLPGSLREYEHNLLTTLQQDVTEWQGIGLEAFMTFFLVYPILSMSLPPASPPELRPFTPFVVAGAVGANILFGGSLTGASLNPARSFGPALVLGVWKDQYVYWIGPPLGALIAAAYYAFKDTGHFFRNVEPRCVI
eukprot:TRINITY_DN6822_c0_g1_i1.p1 TRINITY_DN6822_c0_g1~~TRINITY_DN6822_c0_g1_i1.p1  ORF type:complete len:343 (+),score=41.76 TRINITY_DN6822_c0_g1_i1:73-1101(+)